MIQVTIIKLFKYTYIQFTILIGIRKNKNIFKLFNFNLMDTNTRWDHPMMRSQYTRVEFYGTSR